MVQDLLLALIIIQDHTEILSATKGYKTKKHTHIQFERKK